MDLLGKRSSSRLFSYTRPRQNRTHVLISRINPLWRILDPFDWTCPWQNDGICFSRHRWLEWFLGACVGLFVHVDRTPPRYQSHNACLESRDRLQRICVCHLSEDAFCRLSGNVINPTTHPVNIFTLTDVFSKEFHCSIFLQNHNQKSSIFSFVQIVIQMSLISVDFFIPKFYILPFWSFRLWVMF